MSKSPVRKLGMGAVGIAALVIVFLLMRRGEPQPPLEDATPFKDTTSIIFKEPELLPAEAAPERGRKEFAILTSDEVGRFVSAIRLQRKEPCPCQPHYEATFLKLSGEIQVSFCDHCFDVLDGEDGHSYSGARLYRMPKDFYAEFRRLAQNQKWHVLGP